MKKRTLALVVLAISGWAFADTLETARWQAAIDAAAAKGGGRVVVGPGVHPVGTLWLRSNVELHLAEGAVLLASADKADYNALDAYPENSSCPIENWVGRHLVIAHSVTNVALTGKGVIDGNGEAFFEERVWFVGVYGRRDKMRGDEPTSTGEPFAVWRYGIRWSKAWDDPRPGQMVQFIKCRDVRVEGVKLRNAPCWNLHIWGCDRAHVSDVTVRASRSAANTDGIDIDCSADVTVERCDIDVGDDGMTFRGAEKRLGIVKPCERVTVRDCSIAACSSPFRLGVGTGLVRDILIENVRVWRGGGVLTYSCAYENRGGCDVENVTVRNLVAEGCFAAEVGRNDPLGPDNMFGVRNIKIENCDFARSPAGYGVVANGRNVRLHKVREAIRPDEGSWAGIQRSHAETAEAAFASVVSAGPVAFAVTLPKGASATNPTVRAKDGSFAVVREGDVCRFTVPGPGEYVFEPDATHRHALSLFVNPLRTWDEKWTRTFGPGEHFVGTLRLKDGDRIFLDENAVVYGGIVGENVKDVKICGWGVIDTGCYGRFGLSPESSREKSLSNLAFYGCTDVTVEGPVCVDAAYRCIRTDDCERVTFDNVKTAGQWRYEAGCLPAAICDDFNSTKKGKMWSFTYGGKVAAFSPKTTKTLSDDARKVCTEEAYVSPDGRLALRVTRTSYKKFPACEYRPEFVVLGNEPTEIVADFRSVDATFAGDVAVRALTGTKCTPKDFTPQTATVGSGKEAVKEFRMVATEGRSSADWMPFWGVDFADGSGREFALGWSGPWRADFTAVGTNGVRLAAGMLATHFRLLPGETLRMPSVLVFERPKDMTAVRMKTLVHRFMIDEKAPRDAKGRLLKPLLPLTAGGGNKTLAMMKRMIAWKEKERMPFDCFWIDAGWNGPPHQPDVVSNCGFDWWKYVGDWRMNTTVHPDGNLASVADAAHAAGMKMLLWVEPERYSLGYVQPKVFLEHRDWFLPSVRRPRPWGDNYLLNLGEPAACDFLIDQISGIVRENKLDVYRQDFNFNVLAHWTEEEEATPDRVGVIEAKYIAGLYRFWDTLRERFPDLLIENCASGGRRLDFEAISRTHSYCRTDYVIGFKGDVAQVTDAQNCTYNTLAYQPFQGSETSPAAMFDDYGFFSTVCAASVFTPSDWHGDRAPEGAHAGGLVTHDFTDEENGWFREVFGAADRMRPYYEGDFYPLCGAERRQDERDWCAWQLHRADLDAGFAIVFRRIGVNDRRFACRLGGIDPTADYEVEFFRGEKRRMKGDELAALVVDIKTPRDFRLFFYHMASTR